METLTVGTVTFRKGISRTLDIDSWWRSLLRHVDAPEPRRSLYGADAGRCARLNTLHANNKSVPFEVSDTSAAYMAIGSALEDMLATSLYEANRLVFSNYRLLNMPRLKIGGKIDLVMIDHEDKLSIAEIKSCGNLPTEPKWVHLQQAQTYAAVSGFDRAFLTYVSRSVSSRWGGGLDIRTFVVPTDKDTLYERLRTAALSQLCIADSVLPPKPVWFRKTIECVFCPFTHICWNGEPPYLSEASPELLEELENEADEIAAELMEERPTRHRKTLEHLLEETRSDKTVPALKAEIKRLKP
jgi:hypothetical protein